jgi:hypothetical protein
LDGALENCAEETGRIFAREWVGCCPDHDRSSLSVWQKCADFPFIGLELVRAENLERIAVVPVNDRVNLAWEHHRYYGKF